MTRNRVLIPLDGSNWSLQVLPKIRQMFNPADYELILFRAVDEPQAVAAEPVVSTLLAGMYQARDPMAGAISANRSRQLVHARNLLDRTEDELKHELEQDAQVLRNQGYTVKVTVQFGDPAEEIVNYVRYQDVDMIAMATHGHTGIKRFILGSVAEEIVRHLPIPVLLIRPDA